MNDDDNVDDGADDGDDDEDDDDDNFVSIGCSILVVSVLGYWLSKVVRPLAGNPNPWRAKRSHRKPFFMVFMKWISNRSSWKRTRINKKWNES